MVELKPMVNEDWGFLPLRPLPQEKRVLRFWNLEPFTEDTTPVAAPEEGVERVLVIHEFARIISGLAASRGDEDQERYFFTDVKRFITNNGAIALGVISRKITAAPPTAKYYYASLLAHIEDDATFDKRMELIRQYRRSDDPALRSGAEEAEEYLAL